MPFIPTPYSASTTFALGRRVKLGTKRFSVTIASELRARSALDVSSYKGDKDAIKYLCGGTITLQGGEQGIVVRSDTTGNDVLFLWRNAGKIECALALNVPSNRFVTQRGSPRLTGEPMPSSSTSDVQSATANIPAKAATSQGLTVTRSAAQGGDDVADALETLRQALQPKASVDEDMVRAIVDEALQQSPAAVRQARARRAVSQAAATNPITRALQERYTLGQEAPALALLASPPSLGKSFGVRQFGSQYDLYLEHGCSSDLDEVPTLLGGPVPDGSGFLVVDGVLTQAVRAAAAGQTVLLLLDEVLRLSETAQEWLLMFLTGVKRPDGSRWYRLRTRRVDGGALEVIECPTSHLHIVAAANLGPRHPQDAFWSRFDVVRFGFDLPTVSGIAASVAESFGIDDAQTVGTKWAAAIKLSREFVSVNQLKYPLDIRSLERACQLAPATNATAVLTYAASRIADQCAHWSIDLGETDASCQGAVEAIKNNLLA